MLHLLRRITLGIVFLAITFSAQADKPFRIAAFTPGPTNYFETTFYYFLRGLEQIHLVQFDSEIPISYRDAKDSGISIKDLWDWAGQHDTLHKIAFLSDGFYNENFNNKNMEIDMLALKDRIKNKNDIDLVITLGTLMSRYFVNASPQVPVLVMGSIDPVAGKVIFSAEDSGLDLVTAFVFKDMIKNELEVFYNKVKFKTLGMLYENSSAGIAYSGANIAMDILSKRGVRLVSCFTAESKANSQKEAEDSVIDCFRQLAKTTDAIYVTAQLVGLNMHNEDKAMEMAREYRIPTMVQFDFDRVKEGYFMAYFPKHYFEESGLEYARRVQLIMSGVKPRDIKQVYEFKEMQTCYNKTTADIIGIDVSHESCVFP